MWAKLQRAFAIWSGFGMTLTGVHTCGDYMFSGHTVVLTMLNFFVTECKFFGHYNVAFEMACTPPLFPDIRLRGILPYKHMLPIDIHLGE